MLLHTNSRAPNPRRVHIFLAEKGIDIPRREINLIELEHKGDDFGRINPVRRIPVLELDDGTMIAESVAICRYIEETHPEPPLMGRDAVEKALVEMYQRQVELHLMFPIMHVFRHTSPAMAVLESPQVPDWAEANRPRIAEGLAWLDHLLADRQFVAGDAFSIADISALVAVDFTRAARHQVPEELANLKRWREAVSARPSAAA